MTLSPGTRLGIYEIVSPLGAGGMGEVYRAKDHDLKREVAIKVLPAGVATDADRLSRFRREAELLAALNHQHIAQVYGLTTTPSGASALVMELVEGPTLAEVIARGRIPLARAIEIAVQIADGLEAAHEAGVVHRDLKPANIKVRPDGLVKLLDFGLARSTASPTDSPVAATVTSPAVTTPGLVLGTAAYMSPEQARGQVADVRSDIWAFGCVLFELLTGRSAFPGTTIADVSAAILEREPEWAALPSACGDGIRRVLRRCLAKDRRQRYGAIADVRCDLAASEAQSSGAWPAARRAHTPAWVAGLIGGAVALGVGGVSLSLLSKSEVASPPTR